MTNYEYIAVSERLQDMVDNAEITLEEANDLNEMAYNKYLETVLAEEELDSMISEMEDETKAITESARWKKEGLKKEIENIKRFAKEEKANNKKSKFLKALTLGMADTSEVDDKAKKNMYSKNISKQMVSDLKRGERGGNKSGGGINEGNISTRDAQDIIRQRMGIDVPLRDKTGAVRVSSDKLNRHERTPGELSKLSKKEIAARKEAIVNKRKLNGPKTNPAFAGSNTTRKYKEIDPAQREINMALGKKSIAKAAEARKAKKEIEKKRLFTQAELDKLHEDRVARVAKKKADDAAAKAKAIADKDAANPNSFAARLRRNIAAERAKRQNKN